MMVKWGKHEEKHYLNLAKVGVVGSNPIARSNNFNDLVGNWCSLHRAKLAHS